MLGSYPSARCLGFGVADRNGTEPDSRKVSFMKTLKTLTLVFAVTLLLCATASAAGMDELKHSTPMLRAKLQTALMKKRLGLTPRQVPRVMDINLKYAEQMEPVIKGNGGKLMKMRQARQIGKAKDGELTKVLTPGQFQTYLASREQMRQQMIDKIMEKRRHG